MGPAGAILAAMGADIPVLITYMDQTPSSSDLNQYVFTTQDFGDPVADRIIIVGITGRANAARTISSVTIGGVSATHIATANDAGGGADIASLYIAAVPTGTTGTVDIVFSDVMLRCGIVVWRMTGASATPADTGTDTTLTGKVYSTSIDVPTNGAAVGICWFTGSDPQSVTWAGISEDFDGTVESTANCYSGAHTNFTASQSGLTVSATQAGTPANGGLVVASFGPA